MHPVTQIRNGSGDGQVEVVARRREGVDFPSKARARFTQYVFERSCRTIGGKQIASIVAAIDDGEIAPGN